MKILDFERISSYPYMKSSLAFVAMGDIFEGVASAWRHLLADAETDEESVDILLYIARLYAVMGEMEASLSVLYRALRYRKAHGRIYAMLARDYYTLGDTENGNLYNALMRESAKGEDIESEYDMEYRKRVESKPSVRALESAYKAGKSGDFALARALLGENSTASLGERYELAMCLAIAEKGCEDECARRERDALVREPDDKMLARSVELMEKVGDYEGIATMLERVIETKSSICMVKYWYLVALAHLGRVDEAVRGLEGLERAFGYVYPRIRTTIFALLAGMVDAVTIYGDDSALAILRDSEILRCLTDGGIYRESTFFALVADMYEHGEVTDTLRAQTTMLASRADGMDILTDMALDPLVKSGRVKVLILTEILRARGKGMVVYEGVFNETQGVNRADAETVAFELVSGII